jgi:hypothetical protein
LLRQTITPVPVLPGTSRNGSVNEWKSTAAPLTNFGKNKEHTAEETKTEAVKTASVFSILFAVLRQSIIPQRNL